MKNSQCEVIRFLVSTFEMDLRQSSSIVDGNSPLHWASCGRVSALSTLLSLGAMVNATNRKGATPLILAASNGQVEAVRILLQHGADLSIATTDLQQTAWHVAAQRGFVEVLQELIAHYHHNIINNNNNADGNSSFLAVDSFGNTPLHWACSKMDTLSVLLEFGLLAVDAANNDGETPFLLVARVGKSEGARLLLQHGADVGRVAPNGDTALHIAIHRNNVNIFQELVSHPNCPLDTANSAGLTPLLVAVSRCAGAVPDLLRRGADITRTTPGNGESALHLAVQHGDPVIIEQLLSHYPYEEFLKTKNSHGMDPCQLAVSCHNRSLADLTSRGGSDWLRTEEALRRQVRDLLGAATEGGGTSGYGGLRWRRRRHYVVFLWGIKKVEQIFWSRLAIAKVFLEDDTRMLIGKFL